ncbi:MAG: hypothetical protein JW740_00700 [Candidatus Zambryskibacteria bacterium]|nr:hypothetical protein [Candidatus Zambryskibacteria bacterium]
MQKTSRIIVWATVTVLVLLVLLVTQFTDFGQTEVQWNEAVAYTMILLVAGGAYELIQWLKTRSKMYRVAFGVGSAGLLLLGWVSGAVGIIGSENNPVNLMYWGIPLVMIIGLVVSRLRPGGMAYTLFVAALVQLLIPIAALIISPNVSWGGAGVIGVFILNSIFAVTFIISGLLFRCVSITSSIQSNGQKPVV